MLDNETKRRIDSARDILVGKLPDPKSQVEQITIALIYKFMDDMDKEAVEFGGKATFFTGEFEKYSWSNIFDPKIGGYEMLSLYGEAIIKLNQNPNIPQLFRDIFKNAYLPYRDPETLKIFLKTINEFSYDHSERLGDAFEYLLSVLGSQGDAGQFRTPRHIIDFVVAVMQPKKNETLCDPACGTAGFLISSYKYILQQNTRKKVGDQLTPDDRKKMMRNFVGLDISPDMVRLSLVNMYLHNFTAPRVFEYDTLTSEDRWGESYDIILANPPFMTPKGGIKPHKKFSLQANRSEVLFVDYIAEHINPISGRAGIIVPEGIIFQSGKAYKQLRQMLVDKHYLYAVVSLPAGIFQPYSGVKTSILLMDRTLAKKTDKILFVKIENDGFDLGAQRRAIDKNDLTAALIHLQDYKDAVLNKTEFVSDNENVFAVDKKKIGETGDYNLSVDRYRQSDIIRSDHFEWVEIDAICNLVRGSSPRPQGDPKYYGGEVPRLMISDITRDGMYTEPKTDFLTAEGAKLSRPMRKGDVVMAVSGNPGLPTILKVDACIHDGFVGFRELDMRLMPEFFYYSLLQQKQANYSQSVGAVFKNLNTDQIRRFLIPLPPLSVQQQIVAKIEGYQKIIDGAKQVVENYKPEIDIDPEWEMVELGEVCESFQYGSSKKSSTDGEVVCLRMGNIQKGEIDWTDLKFAPSDEDFESYMLEDGDVLFNRTNSAIHVGKTGIYRGERKAVFAGYLIRLNYKRNLITGEYLNYSLNTPSAKEFCQRVKTDGINQSNINAKVLATFKIPLPPLSLQTELMMNVMVEKKLVNATKELIAIYEQKIKDEINKLWQPGIKETAYEMEEQVSMVAEG